MLLFRRASRRIEAYIRETYAKYALASRNSPDTADMHVYARAIARDWASRRMTSTVGPPSVPWQTFEQIGPRSVQK